MKKVQPFSSINREIPVIQILCDSWLNTGNSGDFLNFILYCMEL